MKTKWIKAAAAVSMALGCLSTPCMIMAEEKSDPQSVDLVQSESETVYVFCTDSGQPEKVMAQPETLDLLADSSKGKSTIEITDIDGKSVTYKGNIEKDIPVSMKIEYQLDGKKISPQDLAGKSGHVKITWTYQSLQKVKVDGQPYTVPFAAVTGLVLDGDRFSNVSIDHGKTMDASGKIVVAGTTFPGLSVSLKGSDIPESFSLEADVKKFALSDSLTVVTDSVFELENLDDLNEKELISALSRKVDDLVDGSDALTTGAAALADGTAALENGAGRLEQGSIDLAAGAQSLDEGAAALQSGSAQLASGLNQLSASNEALVDGAAQIFSVLLQTSNEELLKQLEGTGITIDSLNENNYNQVLDSLIDQLGADQVYDKAMDQAREKVQAQVEANSEAIVQEVTAQVQAQVEQKVQVQVAAQVRDEVSAQVIAAAASGMSPAEYQAAVEAGKIDETTQQTIQAQIDSTMQSTDIQQKIEEQTKQIAASQMQTQEVLDAIAQNVAAARENLVNQALYSDQVQAQIAAAVEQVNASAAQVASLKGSLNSVATFYQGLISYTNGVAQAAQGADALNNGMQSLKGGSSTLVQGASQLSAGMTTLAQSISQLASGADQLKEGTDQLQSGLEQGLSKVEDVRSVLTSLSKAVTSYEKKYDEPVKFIYKTGEIQ